MRVIGTSKLTVLSKMENKSQDGTKTYYKLGVLSGSEAGMVSCSEEIFGQVKEGTSYIFDTVYNDQYKSFNLSRLVSNGGSATK